MVGLKKIAASAACLALLGFTGAPPVASAYDEKADARLAIQQALGAAKATDALVLVVFGANWCEDCRALDRALQAPGNMALLAGNFRLVKVDVGNFNRNIDVARLFGDPLAKGIPSAVVLSSAGQVVYATRAGELANARRMGERGVSEFLQALALKIRSPHRSILFSASTWSLGSST